VSGVFFTSDLHFGHTRIPELSRRPFADVDEMNHALIQNWNAAVRIDDIGWILGDLAIEGQWNVGLECARQMNGRLRLITGNHDQVWPGKPEFARYYRAYSEVFEVVSPWGRTKIGPTKVMLSHFPYSGDHTEEERFDMYRPRLWDRPIVHGHTHAAEKFSVANLFHDGGYTPVPQLHVGVDAWNYFPVPSHHLEALLNEWRTA
jgi:calcineurin-like phosphoesterase family protein